MKIRRILVLRDVFNEFADEATARRLVERKLDADYTDQALMDDPDVVSTGGRMATGVATQAKAQDSRAEQKKKDETALALILESLEDSLARLDARIAELDFEIAELREELTREEQRSEQAFERMHALEDILSETEDNKLTDTNRIALQELLGDKAKTVSDDTLLIALAQAQIAEDLHTGTESYIKSEEIREEIAEREAVRDQLIESRQELANDPSISPEERIRLTEDALEQSMKADLAGAESERSGLLEQNNALAGAMRDDFGDELGASDGDFTFDEEATPEPLQPTPLL